MNNMHSEITAHLSKDEKYKLALQQVKALVEDEKNLIANMANMSAILQHSFQFWWTGFYLVDGTSLVLGPFQGPVACTRINKDRGVCGKAWRDEKTLIIPNVHEFDDHIACSAETNSEIVVPIFTKGTMIGVLDIDSKNFKTFDEVDANYLEQLTKLLVE
jgi:L-methionine (R)-S-oxide reductase